MDFRKNGGKYLVTIEVIILIIVLVLGVLHFIIPDGSKNKTSADEKNNAISGLIVLVKINDKTKYEIPTVINYLKSKGYEISNLNDLIKE